MASPLALLFTIVASPAPASVASNDLLIDHARRLEAGFCGANHLEARDFQCASWCYNNNQLWADKCGWSECRGCIGCDNPQCADTYIPPAYGPTRTFDLVSQSDWWRAFSGWELRSDTGSWNCNEWSDGSVCANVFNSDKVLFDQFVQQRGDRTRVSALAPNDGTDRVRVLNLLSESGFRRGTFGFWMTHQPESESAFNAIWLLGWTYGKPSGFDWPCRGEIDILEGMGKKGFCPNDNPGNKVSVHSLPCGTHESGAYKCGGFFDEPASEWTCDGSMCSKLVVNNRAVLGQTYGPDFNEACEARGCAYFTKLSEEKLTVAFFGPDNSHTASMFDRESEPSEAEIQDKSDAYLQYDARAIGASSAYMCPTSQNREQCNNVGFDDLRPKFDFTCRSNCKTDFDQGKLYWEFKRWKTWSSTTTPAPAPPPGTSTPPPPPRSTLSPSPSPTSAPCAAPVVEFNVP
eukprot:CAMPEP_0115847676 /NCGR_PEP_ID=MMETSP0287-20121206/10508_1 /TAXON_ID=412157 /ORGANISM="Chrysochromulina rotalis, Strain UIO044" /LENGTH=460 /DNA_ID=CAMNT_0003301523 /DNA_START=54 /DNA_END=1432 /DNA_ORIENTATION=+